MSPLRFTKDVFLSCMSAIYLFAFSSLYVQIPGLYGNNGILPVRNLNVKVAETWSDLIEEMPTLLKLTPKLGLDTALGMDLLCLIGMVISFLCIVSVSMRNTFMFASLWVLYLSLFQVGQTFLWFQWDILLLEVGFLLIIVAPLNIWPFTRRFPAYHYHDSITLWLVRWLLFRLMFASGIVKLTSQCPTWWGLTALDYHFESQCLPTPLSWYWHHLPHWFLKLSVVSTYVIEIPAPFLFLSPSRSMRQVATVSQCIPTPFAWYMHHMDGWLLKLGVVVTYTTQIPISFLFFSPVRSMRIFAAITHIVLQVLILLTGNYNFFNIVSIILCIPLFDDDFFSGRKRKGSKKSVIWSVFSLSSFILPAAVYSYIAYYVVKLFSLKFMPDYSLQSNISFTSHDLQEWLKMVMPWTIWMGIISLAYEILAAVVRCFVQEKGFIRRNVALMQCLMFGVVAAAMFCISLVPHTVIEPNIERTVWPSIRNWHAKTRQYELTSSYGLFRRMTGVGGRPELIVEGSHDSDGGWKEYEFLYKPGNISRTPPIVAPHQPRLDWQMWFAALGSYQNNQWFVNLVYRLLTNQKEILELIDRNPFPDAPPTYIKATVYHYHYSKKGSSDWWTREKKTEYLPIVSLTEPTLINYLKHVKIIDDNPPPVSDPSIITDSLQWIRLMTGQIEGFTFLMLVFFSATTVRSINKFIR